MDDKAFGNKVSRDIDKAKEDVATLGEDAVTGLSRIFEQLTDETKVMVTDAVESLNKDVGHGLNQYNAKVQEAADKFPGGFGEKATRYPWVAMSIALAIGILLGNILKPARQPLG
jgi:ElaB/YqjD/DUF883 family membrane-anchored ribosome-binding protein